VPFWKKDRLVGELDQSPDPFVFVDKNIIFLNIEYRISNIEQEISNDEVWKRFA
jgi:hypothetical protein